MLAHPEFRIQLRLRTTGEHIQRSTSASMITVWRVESVNESTNLHVIGMLAFLRLLFVDLLSSGYHRNAALSVAQSKRLSMHRGPIRQENATSISAEHRAANAAAGEEISIDSRTARKRMGKTGVVDQTKSCHP